MPIESMTLEQAHKFIQWVMAHIGQGFERWEVAGSVRRECEHIHDVDIVGIASYGNKIPTGQLFERRVSILDSQIQYLLASYKNIVLEKNGARYKQLVFIRGDKHPTLPPVTKMDIFLPALEDYGRIMVIRTGSADYAKHIAKTWTERGWRGTEKGLRRDKDCYKLNDRWYCEQPNAELPPPFYTEQDFYDWINLPNINPKQRQ